MIYEQGIPDFAVWFNTGLFWLAVLGGILLVGGMFFGFLVSAAQHGPAEGFLRTTKTIFSTFTDDAPGFSLPRVYAIAWLAVQESVRRRVLVTSFGVFIVIMLFAGWFLDAQSDHPARLYLSFVLPMSTMLVIMLSIFLSTLSLPNDIKNKTIYTVVTKPVRAAEIVIGRMVGFMAMGGILLAVMGVLSYVFVIRGVSHSHVVLAESVQELHSNDDSRKLIGYKGVTSTNGRHSHTFEVQVDKAGETEFVQGHRHAVTRNADGTFTVGPQEGQLEAKVPIYGKLGWTDRAGKFAEMGIDVGDEWSYRHYIAGGSKASAVWRFSNLKKEDFPDGIPLEFNLMVFRTYKGDINKTVLGSIALRNPNTSTKRESKPIFFRPKEFEPNNMLLPLKIQRKPTDEQLRGGRDAKSLPEYDLFDDLVDNGQLEIVMQCAEPGQYYGVAEPDVFIRAADNSFVGNFLKCFLTIAMAMTVVVSFGVMYSTFLSGPVAFLATISTIGVGYFTDFVREIGEGTFNPDEPMAYKGGGPIESLVRIMTQQNIQTELEMSQTGTTIIQSIDKVFITGMYGMTFLTPDFNDFDTVRFVAYGYNIDGVIISMLALKTIAYTVGTTLVAYFVLKTREIAS